MTKTPCVLIIIDSAFIGGPAKGVLQLAGFLHSQDIRCIIATFQYKNPKSTDFITALREQNIPFELLPQRHSFDPAPLKKLGQIIKNNNCTILQTHGYKGHVCALPLAKKFHIPWLALTHGWTYENVKVKCYNALERYLLKFPDHVATVSPLLVEELTSIRAGQDVTLIYNAVEAFCPAEKAARQLKADFSIPDTGELYVSAGRLSPEKGHRVLVDAWAIFVKSHPNALLLLAGDGPELQKITQRIQELQLHKSVRLLGHQKNLAALYTVADAFILPSLSEGLPNVMLESMAASVPFIGTRVGSIPGIITHAEDGLLCEPGSVESLTQVLLSFAKMSNPQKQALAVNAKQLAGHFSVESRGAQFLKIYSALLQPPKG